jgi:hypothetical protein
MLILMCREVIILCNKQLQLAKKKVNGALADLNSGEANFFNQHFSTIAAVTNFMDKSLGVVADAGEKYFSEIEKNLNPLNWLTRISTEHKGH